MPPVRPHFPTHTRALPHELRRNLDITLPFSKPPWPSLSCSPRGLRDSDAGSVQLLEAGRVTRPEHDGSDGPIVATG
jgi:hypothetical protein